jgi:putative hemolysin/plastocyanin
VQKGATALQAKINEALTTLQNDGTIAALSQQYLNISPEEMVTPPAQPTPQPTAVPAQPTTAPATCIDNSKWISYLAYDDKNMTAPQVMSPGQPFTMGWRISNSGTCPWTTGYKLVYSYGTSPAAQMGGQPIQVTKTVNPGDYFDFQVNLIAPMTPGTYQGYWDMQNAQGKKLGQTVNVGIKVSAGPTQTPTPSISFKAKPTEINAGDAVTFTWSTSNVKNVYFYHDGQNWKDCEVAKSGEDEEHPGQTITYYLRVINMDNSTTEKAITIKVTQPANKPAITQFDITPATIVVGECANLIWTVTGEVNKVDLAVNSAVVWPNAPLSGSYQDCPTAAGQQIYKLTATGPGGTSEATGTITVNKKPKEPTPTPEAPPGNPASEYCIAQGGTEKFQKRGDGGEYGVCLFGDNRQCEEWAMYNGYCPVGGVKVGGYSTDAAVYCAILGGTYTATGNNGAADEQGTCSLPSGVTCDVWDLWNGICNPYP